MQKDKIEENKLDWQHPYAGLRPFRVDDRDFFHGRKNEIHELEKLIIKNVLTVIFGKSGIGKTSLLQAGLIPRLKEKYYVPIYLRIEFDNKEKTPIDQVKEEIEKEIKRFEPAVKPFDGRTLWEYFGEVKILDGLVKPLLFFDQFEEIFTKGKNNIENVNEFVTEITDLIEDLVPLVVQREYEEKRKPLFFPDRESDFRVIFSLREDYLPQLRNFSRYMPSIESGRCHYRVRQMKGKDAIDAVLKPGKEIISDRAVGEEIIKKIPVSKDDDYSPYEEQKDSWESKKIEPFLLSLFCYQVNEIRLTGEKKTGEITIDLLDNIKAKDIVEAYLTEKVEPDIRKALEDQLLTDDGHRKLQPINDVKNKTGITEKRLHNLVKKRIIRRESRSGTEYIELIHDVLAPILKKSRDERKQKEEKIKLRKELDKQRKKSRTRKNIIFLTAIVSAFLVLLTLYAYKKKEEADKESRNSKAYALAARSVNLADKDAELGFRLAERAYRTKDTNPGAYNALLKAYYNKLFCRELNESKVREFHPKSETSEFFAVFAPDKERLRFVTVSSEQLILWNLSDGKENKIEPKNELGLRAKAAVSPDGKYFAFLTRLDEEIGIWELDKDKIVSLKLGVGVNSVAFSPDGKKIVTGNRDNTARLWDLEGNQLTVFEGHENEVISAVFSPEGKHIVTGAWDGTARLWSREGKKITKFNCSEDGSVNSVAFSPDEKYILTADNRKNVQLWKLDGELLRVFEGHTGGVKSALFSPDGKYIVTASDDETVRLWDLDGNQVFKFEGFKAIIHTASFSPDGKYLLIAPAEGPAQLRLVNPEEIIRFADENGVRRLPMMKKRIIIL